MLNIVWKSQKNGVTALILHEVYQKIENLPNA